MNLGFNESLLLETLRVYFYFVVLVKRLLVCGRV